MNAQQEHGPRFARGPDRAGVRYIGMGVELAAAIVGLTLLGLWIDHSFGTGPVGIIVGACVGVVGGLYNFIRGAWRLSGRPTFRGATGEKTQKRERRDEG